MVYATLKKTELARINKKRARHYRKQEFMQLMHRAGLNEKEQTEVLNVLNEGRKADAERLFTHFKSLARGRYRPQTKAQAASMLFDTGRKTAEVQKILKVGPQTAREYYVKWIKKKP